MKWLSCGFSWDRWKVACGGSFCSAIAKTLKRLMASDVDVVHDRADEKGVAWPAISGDVADGDEVCRVALLGALAAGLDEGDVRGTDARGHDSVGEREALEGTVGVDGGAGARDATGSHAADDAVYAVAVPQRVGGGA